MKAKTLKNVRITAILTFLVTGVLAIYFDSQVEPLSYEYTNVIFESLANLAFVACIVSLATFLFSFLVRTDEELQ